MAQTEMSSLSFARCDAHSLNAISVGCFVGSGGAVVVGCWSTDVLPWVLVCLGRFRWFVVGRAIFLI